MLNCNAETIYLYFVKKGKNRKEEVSRKAEMKNLHIVETTVMELQRLLEQFGQESELLLGDLFPLKCANLLFAQFVAFFREFLLAQKTELTSVQKQIYELPYSFNNFFESGYAPVSQSSDFMQICSTFLLFSKWLNWRNHSDLILI